MKGYEPLEGAQPPDPSAGARRYAEASGGTAGVANVGVLFVVVAE